jgi:TrmH family RNA methyltransferase
MTQNDLKYYSSLLKKKFRFQENKFLAEGKKIVEEGINSKYWCEKIFISQKIYENLKGRRLFKNIDYEVLSRSELMRLTDTVAPQGILGVFRIREIKKIEEINSNIIVFLENISDPGNLGTIIRICDWFGINTILCSDNTVDAYNPKVIRSSMGSIFHLDIIDDFKTDSLDIFLKKGYKLVSTDLNGKNLYEFKIADKIIISFSNETTGPSESLLNKSDYKITIPKIGKAESLNVAAASAVILAELTKPFIK